MVRKRHPLMTGLKTLLVALLLFLFISLTGLILAGCASNVETCYSHRVSLEKPGQPPAPTNHVQE